MTTITTTTRVPMSTLRKTAFIAGALYLLTFVSSIPAVPLLGPVLNDPNYIIGSGADTRVLFACLLDLINALAAIGTAVALFPVVRRQNENLALGFVTTRLFEAAVIVIGIVSLMSVVTLRHAGASGPEADSLVIAGHSLVAVRNWTMLLGPGVMAALNGLMLGTLMYRSRLVPRIIPTVGLIGVPLLLISVISTWFGGFDQFSGPALVLVLPIAAWEFSLGVWLVVKGFNRAAIERLAPAKW
jgi:Domain of unknown function (DUF4386)